MKDNIIIYENKNGTVELRADIEKDTIWATQAQMAQLFEIDIRTVNEHLKNIFITEELKEISTIRKFRIVQSEGGRKVRREVNLYNLDAVIAVGYRVNSKKATQFRIWATGVLREYLKQGYVLNRYRLDKAPEALKGLGDALALIESNKYPGKLKGKIIIKLTKNMESSKK
jgi:hypothetical protein